MLGLLDKMKHPFSLKPMLIFQRFCPCICHTLKGNQRFMHVHPWADKNPGKEIKITVGKGVLKISSGKLARFADGCATAQLGDTTVLVTAVGKARSSAAGFLPLTVDYRQKAAAAGRIPTNYLRRELGPSDKEILTSRMIDRSLRPLFPQEYFRDIQIMCNLLAVDGKNDPDIVSINAASAALALSDIPWNGPVGAVRVGYLDNELVINPTRKQLHNSLLNLVVTGTEGNKTVMLEASAECLPHSVFKKAIEEGVQHTQAIIHSIRELQTQYGKDKKENPPQPTLLLEVEETISSMATTRIWEVLSDYTLHKISRDEALTAVREDVITKLKDSYPDIDSQLLVESFYSLLKKTFREMIFEKNIRCDGRSLTNLRPISCQSNLYPPLHGSALFQRGQTQVLCTVTFDSAESAAKVDTMSSLIGGVKEKNFFLHYEFPPYATNETGRPGMVGRRELGHGALAEKALRPVVPNNYPFTIRLTAEVLESNGSSSMASACGGSLALMDAGVPLSQAVAGVAVGLVTKSNPNSSNPIDDHRLLTDLLGIEDYMGDMDFKLAGTRTGVTALQADIKLDGLPLNIVLEAVDQAADGKNAILDIMDTTLSKPRQERKENSPMTEKLEIPVNQRSRFLGVGAINLRRLRAEIGVTITPLEDSSFQIFAPNQTALDEAKEKIDDLLAEEREPELEFGAIYRAKIVEIREYGAMVQIFPTMTPTLVHNSQLDQRKVSHASALGLEVGQEISVKYFGRDPASGKMRLSRKVLQGPASTVIKNLGEKPS